MNTDRLNLRLVDINDSTDIYNILSNDNVNQNLNMDKPKDINDINELINKYFKHYQEETYEHLAITLRDTNEFVGVFLFKLDLYNEDAYECTIYIDEKFWNKGITTEVMKFMVNYFFNNYKQSNFRGYIMEKNTASARVFEKCNFKLERIFKVDGIDGNILSYLMTREDYFNI